MACVPLVSESLGGAGRAPPGPCALSRREERRLDRQQAILAVAAESFLKQGYAGTSMSGIAAALGGSKGTLWSYFPCKEDLFAAVLDRATETYRAQLSAMLDPDGDPPATIEDFCSIFVQRITSDDAIALYRLVVGEAGRFPEIGRIYHDRVLSVTHGLLASFIAQAMDRGVLRRDDPARAARLLATLCRADSHQQLLTGMVDTATREDIAADAERAKTFFLRAYAPGVQG